MKYYVVTVEKRHGTVTTPARVLKLGIQDWVWEEINHDNIQGNTGLKYKNAQFLVSSFVSQGLPCEVLSEDDLAQLIEGAEPCN